MVKKLFLLFVVLNLLALTDLAVRYPSKNEHTFRTNSAGMRIESYDERWWVLLPPARWGMDLFVYNMAVGCGGLGSHASGTRRFGFIGIVEESGWQTTEEEWKKAQKIKARKG